MNSTTYFIFPAAQAFIDNGPELLRATREAAVLAAAANCAANGAPFNEETALQHLPLSVSYTRVGLHAGCMVTIVTWTQPSVSASVQLSFSSLCVREADILTVFAPTMEVTDVA